jgi:hypothetical protein
VRVPLRAGFEARFFGRAEAAARGFAAGFARGFDGRARAGEAPLAVRSVAGP